MQLLILFSTLCFISSVYSQCPQCQTCSSSCPGGRIEYRKTGKFCCYDKEETVCTKIIKAPTSWNDEVDRAAFAACPKSHPVVSKDGQKCCTCGCMKSCIPRSPMDDDRLFFRRNRRNRLAQILRPQGQCPAALPLRFGTQCCNQLAEPRTCMDFVADELGDEKLLLCPIKFPFKIDSRCCNRILPSPLRICMNADEVADEVGDEMGDEELGDEVAGDEDRRRCPRRYPYRVGNRCCNRRFRPRQCIFADE